MSNIGITSTDRFSVYCLSGECKSLRNFALDVLKSHDLDDKCEKVRLMHKLWFSGKLCIELVPDINYLEVPDQPGRPEFFKSSESNIKESLGSKAAVAQMTMLHGICHAESYAIDLFVDLIARFGTTDSALPKAFYDDFVEVANQEATHYLSWKNRLRDLNIEFGMLPTHDGLWRAAYETRNDLLDRLAVINMVHEARGLDTASASIRKLKIVKDVVSEQILLKNFEEEIEHVQKGVRWFTYVAEKQRHLEAKTVFQDTIRRTMKLPLKGPFNFEARKKAGFPIDWFQELAQ